MGLISTFMIHFILSCRIEFDFINSWYLLRELTSLNKHSAQLMAWSNWSTWQRSRKQDTLIDVFKSITLMKYSFIQLWNLNDIEINWYIKYKTLDNHNKTIPRERSDSQIPRIRKEGDARQQGSTRPRIHQTTGDRLQAFCFWLGLRRLWDLFLRRGDWLIPGIVLYCWDPAPGDSRLDLQFNDRLIIPDLCIMQQEWEEDLSWLPRGGQGGMTTIIPVPGTCLLMARLAQSLSSNPHFPDFWI